MGNKVITESHRKRTLPPKATEGYRNASHGTPGRLNRNDGTAGDST